MQLDLKTLAAVVVISTFILNLAFAHLGLPARVTCSIAQASGMNAVLITQE